MTGSAHALYRDRLLALVEPGALAGVLAEWAGSQDLPPALAWVREYGRFHPGLPSWATLTFVAESMSAQAATVRIEVHEERPAEAGTTYLGDIGWVRASGLASDPVLPSLGAVLDTLDGAAVVRYRPGSRCTVRGRVAAGERFVKVTRGARQLQEDAVELWRVARGGALPFDVAEAHGWHESTSSSWYGLVAGRPIVDAVLGVDGASVVRRLGAALGALAASPVRPTMSVGPREQLARTARAAGRAGHLVPDLASALDGLLGDLERGSDDLRARELVPVHGAPHVHQWLDDDGRLGLVDFDRLARGDPELDVATFLAELDSETDRCVEMGELEAAMVAGFEETGPQLDPARLQLYRAHKRVAKVARTAYALRPDGDQRAARHLAALTSALAPARTSARALRSGEMTT